MATSYYATKISPHRGRTEEGYLVCAAVPVARTGYQYYDRRELDFEPSESVKKNGPGYDVFRPEAEVFSVETLSSLEGKPVTDDHPAELVTSDNWQIYAKGNVKNARRGEGEYKDFILADLVVWDKGLIEKIENGKQAVSVGYSCDYEEADGELRQKDIICNHVAVVDEGRAGEKAIIRDSPNFDKEASMAEEEIKKEELVEKDECKNDECKETKDSTDEIDLAEVVRELAERVGRQEERIGRLEARLGEKERDGFDELEEEIFKEKKEEPTFEEKVEEKREQVGDSVLVSFIRQVKPLVAKVKDEKERALLKDSMCKVIKSTLMNDSKKEVKKTVYSDLVQSDKATVEDNPYEKFFRK